MSSTNNTSPADEVLRKSRIAELAGAIEETDGSITTREAAERTDVPLPTAKRMLRIENAFYVDYAERIRGASYRHYWGVRPEEVDNTFVRSKDQFGER